MLQLYYSKRVDSSVNTPVLARFSLAVFKMARLFVFIRAKRTPGEVAVSGVYGRFWAGETSPGTPKTNSFPFVSSFNILSCRLAWHLRCGVGNLTVGKEHQRPYTDTQAFLLVGCPVW